MNRDKFWCQPCDLVFKGNHPLTCPGCNKPMRCMGDKWRVGAKGHRVDWIPRREDDHWWWWYPSDSGTMLERKLRGEITWDKKRGRWALTRT